MLKKVLIYILVALFILAALPLLIVFGVPILAFWGIYAWVTLWAFRRREAGRVYLVCTARRNWHDLLVNHIIPALPEGSRVARWRLLEAAPHRRPRVARRSSPAVSAGGHAAQIARPLS